MNDQDTERTVLVNEMADGDYWDKLPRVVTLDRNLSDGAFRLYAMLLGRARNKPETWVSNRLICESLGIARSTCQKRLLELEQQGWIGRGLLMDGPNRTRRTLRLRKPPTVHKSVDEVLRGPPGFRAPEPENPCDGSPDNRALKRVLRKREVNTSTELRKPLKESFELWWSQGVGSRPGWKKGKKQALAQFGKALKHPEISQDVRALVKRTQAYLHVFEGCYRHPVDPERFLKREYFTSEELENWANWRQQEESRGS